MNNLITRRRQHVRSSMRALRTIIVGAFLAASAVVVQTPALQAASVPCSASALVTAVGSVASSGGSLSLAAGCTYTLTTAPNSLDGPNAFDTIVAVVTIDGNGATITRSTAGGTPDFRFFIIDSNGDLTLNNLTLSNGSIPSGELHGGGAIINRDHLTVNGVSFLNNHSMGNAGGGAIDNHDEGVLSVTNSAFDSNVALQGGAIEDEATLCHISIPSCGNATVTNSTFSNNSTTSFGGAGFESQLDNTSAPGASPICGTQPASSVPVECQEVGGAHDTLTGDTFTGNTATGEGGGIANFGTTTVLNSTITGNTAGSACGGGVQNTWRLTITESTIAANTSVCGSDVHEFDDTAHQGGPPVTTLVRTIVSGGVSSANCSAVTTLSDGGHNLDDGTSCGFTKNAQNSTDPMLRPLASNGGPTQTMLPGSGSKAIDNGGACSGTDQRGAPRPQGPACDIGSVEIYTTPPTVPTGLAANVNGAEIDLTWSASSSPIGVAGYDITRDGTKIATVSGSATSYADTTATPNINHTYTVDAFDAVGNTSGQSNSASATIVAAPSVPTGLQATSASPSVVLTWNASTDTVPIAGYTIYRNGTAIGTVDGSTLTFTDPNVISTNTYSYTVDAFDGAGNHSAQSTAVIVTTSQIWNSLGGLMGSGMGGSSWGSSRVDVFVEGADGGLWQDTWNGSSWSGWSPLGGIITGAPGAVDWSSGRIDVFVRGQDKALWHRSSDGTTWTPWEFLGGGMNYGPTVASWQPQRLDVVIVGLDHQLWHKFFDGTTWSGWEPLGGILTSQPAAVSWGPDELDIIARGSDGQMWHMAWAGNHWTGWQPLGGLFNSGPAVASCASGHLDVYGVGLDNGLWHDSWNGTTWSGWQPLGGTWTAAPGAVCEPGTSLVQVFERAPDGSGMVSVMNGT